MTTTQLRAPSAGALFVVIFAFGFWLTKSGEPRNALILNAHKLVTLAAMIWLGRTVYLTDQSAALGAMGLLPTAITGLLLIGTIATGGLLSIGKPMPEVVVRLHHVTPYLTVLSTAVTLYLLPRQ